VIIEKHADPVFMKLLVIYDHTFEKVSDNQFVKVQFLDFDSKKNAYCLVENSFKTIKVNKLMNLPARARLAFKIRRIFGL
jgi:hypothetical protein